VKVKKLFSDNGGEYIAEDFGLLYHRNGIKTLHTSAHSPEQNGICQRFNRALIEALRTVLLTSPMARAFWGEFIMSSTYVRNHLLYSSLPYDMSPMEAAFGTVPVYLRYRALGCDCYTMLDIEGQDKLQSKTFNFTRVFYVVYLLSGANMIYWKSSVL
jgi:transposase InsO family protein